MNKIKEEHKTTYDLKQLLKNSKFFNLEFYKKQNPYLKNTNYTDDEVIEYYLKHNKEEQIPTSKYFDVKWYMKHNPTVKKMDMDPLIHFLKIGREESILYRYIKEDLKSQKFDKLNLYRIYETIYNSELFDIDYYLSNNGEFDLEGYDPIIHYILIGAKRGYNPSRKFNTNLYLDNQKSDNVTTNPLYHYILYGKGISNKKFSEIYLHKLSNYNEFPPGTVDDILIHLKNKISIIIPIYNAYEETCECIRSVLLNTYLDYELILINDASTDKRIKILLDKLEGIENIKIIHNSENQGFVKNVNTGMKIAGNNDVVLLNSDTIVTPRWLTKLITAAYSDPTVATATPLSNSSDISAKNLGINKDQIALNKKAYQLSKLDYDSYLESPTGNGYCLFIKRGALNKLGLFDPIFERGYGEETDFTSKAREAGWKNLRIFDTFIYHRNHASFKEKTNQLNAEHKKINMKRHPDVFRLWDEFVKEPHLNEIIKKTENIPQSETSERILYVTQLDKEGNPEITPEFYEIAQKYDTYILTLTQGKISFFIYDGVFEFKEIYTEELINKTDDEIKTFYFNFITLLRYDLFYIRQVGNYSSSLFSKIATFVKLSKPLEIPVIYEGKYYYDNLMDEIKRKLNPIHTLDELIDKFKNHINFKDKKVAIYTAITGGFDDLHELSVVNENFDYICFTDDPNLKSDFWDVRLIDNEEDNKLDVIRKARRYKMFPHIYLKDYDYSLWIDGNFDIVGDVEEYVNTYLNDSKLLAIPHEERDCIYEEGRATIEANKDYPDIVNLEMEDYKKEGYPEHYGLIVSGIIFRDHHDPEVIKLMEDWFREVQNYSQRCQLSFNYVCWKNNFKYDQCDLYYYRNQYFFRTDHSEDKIEHVKYPEAIKDRILENLTNPTTIIIPVKSSYDDTLNCINSVLKYTTHSYDVVLIDDTKDKKVNTMLMEFSENYDNIHVITNNKNDVTYHINHVIKSSDNEIVILESNTIVTPHWLNKLKLAAYIDTKIGTVIPLSNNSQKLIAQSQDYINLINDDITLNKAAKIIEKQSNDPMNIPVSDSFCIFIKRALINDIGVFDLKYKKTYDKIIDFSMRTMNGGWNNMIDMSTYVYQNNKTTDNIEDLLDEEDKTNSYFMMKYPDYEDRITKFIENPEYLEVVENLNEKLHDKKIVENNKEKLLYVINDEETDLYNLTLALSKHSATIYDVYILTAAQRDLKLYKVNPDKLKVDDDIKLMDNLINISGWRISDNYKLENPALHDLQLIYLSVLKQLQIDIVHIQHLLHHSFDMPKIGYKMGLKVILSLNDEYLINPTNNILTQNSKTDEAIKTLDILKEDNKITDFDDEKTINEFLDIWHKNVSEIFNYSSEIITPSKELYDKYTDQYPQLKDKSFKIIGNEQD